MSWEPRSKLREYSSLRVSGVQVLGILDLESGKRVCMIPGL